MGVSLRILPEDWLRPLPLEKYFIHGRRLEVDVGCGKGRFLLAHAAANPAVNFLGIDRMLRRIRKIDRKAARRGLDNIRLLRMDAYYAVTYLLPEKSVSVFYIFFPDPWPKKRHAEHRLFNSLFMDALLKALVADGQAHFATDHLPYFEQVKELLIRDPRIEPVEPYVLKEEERTDFELLFHGLPVGRYSFRKKKTPPNNAIDKPL